jgi:hypothetical protein
LPTGPIVAERAAWQVLHPNIDIDRLVLIDETSASTLKAAPRKAAANSIALLLAAIAEARGTFTSQECSNFFAAL